MERAGAGLMGVAGMGQASAPAGAPGSASWLMLPRCVVQAENCAGGMRLTCSCDDPAGRGMVQELCGMLAGGMCTCCALCNGLVVCSCHLTMGLCSCAMTPSGVCITCTSGDARCCEVIQALCDCLACLLKGGCICCLRMNNTPVGCGTC